jgi:hypothetical protein
VGEPEIDPAVAEALERAKAEVAAIKAKAAKDFKDRQKEAEAKKAEKKVEKVSPTIVKISPTMAAPTVVPFVAVKPRRETERAFFDPNDLTRVSGVVGRLIDWETSASLYPNPPLALGSALATVGTLIWSTSGWPGEHFDAWVLCGACRDCEWEATDPCDRRGGSGWP